MQIGSPANSVNVSISPEVEGINSFSGTNSGLKRKVLFTITVLLILCFGTASILYIFVNNNPEFAKNLADRYLNYDRNRFSDELELARQYTEQTLSYFTPNELTKLGVLPLPDNYSIQEEYKGIKLVRSESDTFSDLQINLLKMFIDMTPKKLLEPGPSAIVTFKRGEIRQGTNFNPNTAAFASGPYVFFNDNSFDPNVPLADDSVDAAYNTFIHELTHVAQFNAISANIKSSEINSSYDAGLSWIDLVLNSELVEEYAVSAGWVKTSDNGKLSYSLPDPANAKTSEYGKTRVYEDMSETVAGVVSTDDSKFSEERKNWAYKFLNESADSLKIKKLPFSANLEQVKANNLQYDNSKDNYYKSNYTHFVKQIFLTQKLNSIEQIYNFYNSELKTRGWSGSLKRSVDANNVIRYKGDFNGEDRDMYIEIYSYDQATGYLVKPKGTIVVIVSGYIPKSSPSS